MLYLNSISLFRVRKSSTLFPPPQPTWHFLSDGVPHLTRMRCSSETRLICVTSALSNKETPYSYQQVSCHVDIFVYRVGKVLIFLSECQKFCHPGASRENCSVYVSSVDTVFIVNTLSETQCKVGKMFYF